MAGDPQGMRELRQSLSPDGSAGEGERRDRRQQVQAVNNRDRNFTRGRSIAGARSSRRVWRGISPSSIRRTGRNVRAARAQDDAAQGKARQAERGNGKLAAYEKQMLASPDGQISLTDPDSRSMATSGRGSGVVGYNVQVRSTP